MGLTSELLVLATDGYTRPGETLSDRLLHDFKGRQGCYAAGTFRGEIAFNALSNLTNNEGRSIRRIGRTALDPIGAIRALVRNEWPSDGAHEDTDNPVLFYAGQGVHIPDSDELSSDMRILLNEEDIDLIRDASPQLRATA